MNWIGSTPAAAVSEPVCRLVEMAVEQGNVAPYGLVFLDSAGQWRNAVAGLTLARRKVSVAVALDDEDLVAAARWFIGGGVLLPPSTTRIAAACRAADDAGKLLEWFAEPIAFEELDRCPDRLRIALRPQEIWSSLAGLRSQLEVLAALATAVEQPAVVGPGPTLIVNGVRPAVVEEAWKGLEIRPSWSSDQCCLAIEATAGRSCADRKHTGFGVRSLPVAQWPSGRIVGSWSTDASDRTSPWQLFDEYGKRLDVTPVTTRGQLDHLSAEIFRVVGIPSSELERAGSPGAIVVENLAREADRIGAKLWISGVSTRAGAVIRHWGVPLWVDGSSVSD